MMPQKMKLKPFNSIFFLLLIAFLCLPTLADQTETDPAVDAENFGELDKLMFWAPREKVAGFRNIEKLYSTRAIERGNQVYPLCTDPVDLSGLSYEVGGKKYTFDEFITRNRVAGLVVIKDNRIVEERYALGNTATSPWISFSVAKSVVSMLVGAAIKDGYIHSVDEKVADYLPQLKGSPYENVSIKNILQMASGVEWNEDYADPESDVNNMPREILELFKMLRQKKKSAEPGTRFNYNTAETHLVGAVVRAAIGNNLSTYLTHKIWIPLGMESDATWLLHGPGGGEMGGCCINAILRDYARIGLFAMQDGVLPDGTRILPENWMKESITPSAAYPNYGYLWWLGEDSYVAHGIFGQLISIHPDEKLVIAMLSAWEQAVSSDYMAHQDAFIQAVVSRLKKR